MDSEGEDSDEMQRDEKDTEKKQPTLQQWLRKRGCFVGAAPLQVCCGTDLRNGTSSKLNGLMWPLLQIIGSTTCKHRSMHRGTHTQKKR